MIEQTITYNGVPITLQRATVRSRLYSGVIYRKFDIENLADDELAILTNYVRFLTQVKVGGDIGFKVPAATDEFTDLLAGYEAFLDMPETFFDTVIMPLTRLDNPLTEVALQPLDDDQKKD